MPELTINDVTKTLKDAAYVAVGFGVLAVQRAQVRRRELEKRFEVSGGQLRDQLAKVADEVEERLEPVVEAVDAQLDQLEVYLPDQAKVFLRQARTTAKEAGAQLRQRAAAKPASTGAGAVKTNGSAAA